MEINIRPVHVNDSEAIGVLRRMPGIFENMLGLPSDRTKRSEEAIANMGRNTHAYVATISDGDQEVIIGYATLSTEENPRVRHSGSIGIMVHVKYQDRGVGSLLLKTLLDLADQWLMLIRVDLTVYIDNERAIHLYEKYGFEIEGRLRKASVRQGQYIDAYMMSRIREPGAKESLVPNM